MGFPGSLDSKDSFCNGGDLGLILQGSGDGSSSVDGQDERVRAVVLVPFKPPEDNRMPTPH